MTKKIAVVLCGSGYRDGSEIRESVGVLWALSRQGAQIQCFAPDAPQTDVINCLTNQVVHEESRNMLVEAARIARGQVLPLNQLDSRAWNGVMLPGGFGAAKNLCSFATQGSKGKVRPELQKVLSGFFAARKPIGAVCIAPAILALAFPNEGLELTVGAPSETAQEIEKLGHRHIPRAAHEFHVDETHRIVTTPAYMQDDAPLHRIFEGIDSMVAAVLRMA